MSSVKLIKGQPFKNFLDTLNNENKINDIHHEGEEEATQLNNEQSILWTYQITTSNLRQSPDLKFSFGDLTINALIDSGSQISLMAEHIYNQLLAKRYPIETLPVTCVVVTSAFVNRSSRIKLQALIPFKIGNESFDYVCLISSQLKF
jgi:hypothetical protein